MTDREKNPSRCRELRQIDRTIREELSRTNEKSERTWRAIENLRNQINGLREKSESLQKQLAAGVAASAIRGPGGVALGASLVKLEVQYELLRQEIDRLQGQLEHLEYGEQQLRRDHDRWQVALQENANNMTALNCVA